MLENIESIKNTPLLKPLSEKDILTHLKKGTFKQVNYPKNSILHFDGDACTKLEIILSGNVVVERIDFSGDLLTISEFYSDDILGGNLLFSKNPYYPMTVSTRTHTTLLEIDKEALFHLFCSNPSFLKTYLEFISEHSFILGDTIKHYVKRSIRESVMHYLNYQQRIQNTNAIKLPITKKALAEKIGVQRTSLSRELAKMQKERLISMDGEFITILYDGTDEL